MANSPMVSIAMGGGFLYDVYFYEIINNEKKLIGIAKCIDGQSVNLSYTQTYVNWYIRVVYNGEIISEDTFNPQGKVIVIKMDAYALGDNIAWIPYVEEFRIKHNCTVICSTFYNDLFKDNYPNIIFVPPNTNIENIYSQYYIGASNDDNFKYSLVKVNENKLQSAAFTTLGLEDKEIKPILTHGLVKVNLNRKYICISEFGSSVTKEWKENNGWQNIVDYLKSKNFDVVVISKEPTNLNGVIDLTGDRPLVDRCQVLYNSEFFIGISSGLSWLAWGVGVPIIMISDVTPIFHEFECHRISENKNLNKVDYDLSNYTKYENVIEVIDNLINKDIY